MKKKIMTVVGTRPEIIRLSQLIKRLDAFEGIDHLLVHTGQNYDYELNEIFFEDLELRKPDYFLNAAGTSASDTIGNVLIKMNQLLLETNPHIFLVLGDTNSALSAIAAKKHNIPVYHCEAGNRSFDERVPEEMNRRLIDHIADVNLPYSQIARQHLLAEGLPSHRIIVTGSPMKELLDAQKVKIDRSKILHSLGFSKKEYFVVSAHREENVSNPKELKKLLESLNSLASDYNKPILVSTHPRFKKELEKTKEKMHPNVVFSKPLNYSDYVHLQMNAVCTLSDSGTISEESAILGFPAVNIRYSQERPEAFEMGVLPLVGLEYQSIQRGIKFAIGRKRIANVPMDYLDNQFSYRVANTILMEQIFLNG
jgi:UDP-N-acetylglucosamine 2-epimerase (non-hydrolysing)